MARLLPVSEGEYGVSLAAGIGIMKMKIAWIGIAIGLAVSGCRTWQDLQFIAPTFSMTNIQPRVHLALPVTASRIDFDITLRVDNPNPIGMRLDRIDFDMLVNGNPLMRGFTTQRFSVPARGSGDIRFQTTVGYSEARNVFDAVANIIQGGRPEYEMRGTAHYHTPAGPLQLPFSVQTTQF